MLPILAQVRLEQQRLENQRIISQYTFEKLQETIATSSPTNSYTIEHLINKPVTISIQQQNDDLLEGCADWTNERKIKQSICFYGVPKP
ncbi:hypothetical protein [Gracilibacillus sp. YIM 98692]|uniref:hypothetical protein n=1 Tax=Gracilibacillus sp. YIM 98692 TaxID=2663532 RepID=UPI0013CF7B80|nr:hypothetical protein [Gracilibacillus sp. YIM 98692]